MADVPGVGEDPMVVAARVMDHAVSSVGSDSSRSVHPRMMMAILWPASLASLLASPSWLLHNVTVS